MDDTTVDWLLAGHDALKAEVARLRAERDTLAAELDTERHDFVSSGAAVILGCDKESCLLLAEHPVHRTSRVVLAEHAKEQ